MRVRIGATRKLAIDVCAASEIPLSELMSSDRSPARVYRPRHCFYWLAYRRLGRTLNQVGLFIRRDHTTILHGVRRVDHAIQEGDRRYTDIIAEAMKGDA